MSRFLRLSAPSAATPYRGILFALVAGLLGLTATLASHAVHAQSLDFKAFVGQYVGQAKVFGEDGELAEIRDLDIEIEPYKKDGLTVRWTNVSLVDGSRIKPGVKRRVSEVTLERHEDSDFFVESQHTSPFRETAELAALRGDAVRWAVIEDDTIQFYSFQMIEDGAYELQTYARRLNESGLDLTFQRIVDGEVKRSISGEAVRAD